jgi:hypothetical protein
LRQITDPLKVQFRCISFDDIGQTTVGARRHSRGSNGLTSSPTLQAISRACQRCLAALEFGHFALTDAQPLGYLLLAECLRETSLLEQSTKDLWARDAALQCHAPMRLSDYHS